MSACRLCRDSLDGASRIRIAPAPSGAQHFEKSAAGAKTRSITLEIAECGSCGLVQSVSAPVEGHERAITAAGISAPMREHRFAQARRLAAALGTNGGRIALVGCGNGYELTLLQEAGFQPEGIESGGAPPGYAAAWPIHDGYPRPGAALPAAPYDAFACYNFLEHAPDPRGFLSSIADSLSAAGGGVVEVPNYDRQRLDGRAADYVADHLSYFDATTFRAMLMIAGFNVVSVTEVRGGENLEAIVRRRACSTIERDTKLLAHARSAVRGFFKEWSNTDTPAVAWGASHQALTLFAGLSGAEQPRAIIDGAAFKQGLFAPPSGIPIVAPSLDALRGVGAVLIVATGYEAEIAARLRGEFGFSGYISAMHGHELRRVG
jgi:hypothetical protein